MCVCGEVGMCDDIEKGLLWVIVVVFFCVYVYRREVFVVIESFGFVRFIVDVMCYFFEVLEVGFEGYRVRRERDAIRVRGRKR